jgi:hypothetical protein
MEAGQEILNCFLPSGPPVSSKAWSAHVIDQTLGLPQVEGQCEMIVEFVMPAERERLESPAELRLDYLLKRLLDALEGTLLRGAGLLGEAGEIVSLRASRRPVGPNEASGIRIILRRLDAAP